MVEMMIAVAIIGVMVMTVAPSLQQALGDNRQTSAAGELIRIGRRARGLAISTGVAHLLRFREAEPAASNLGMIDLFVGMNSKCLQTNWAQAIGMTGQPIGVFDMTSWNPSSGGQPRASDTGRQVITLRANTDGVDRTVLYICFQANGDVFTNMADGTTQLAMQRDRARFTIARTIDSVSYGATRVIVFPAAGSARFE